MSPRHKANLYIHNNLRQLCRELVDMDLSFEDSNHFFELYKKVCVFIPDARATSVAMAMVKEAALREVADLESE